MPDWKPDVRERLAGLRLHPAREAEIVEELAAHLDERYHELVAAGETEAEAARLTRIELSDPDLLRHQMAPLRQSREPEPIVPGAVHAPAAGWTMWLGDTRRDVRYAWRMLARTPGFTVAAVLTLGLGIGVTSAVFSLLNATLLARIPVVGIDALVYVGNGERGFGVFAYPEYVDLRDRNDVFSSLVAWGGITASLNADGQTDTVNGAIVTGNYFEALGVTAPLGRVLSPSDDDVPGGHPVVVISHGLWQRRFGGRADIIGQAMVMNGRPFTIVGVTHPEFFGPQLRNRDVWVPMMMQAIVRPPRAGYSGEMNPDLLRTRGNRWLFFIGRLKPGVTREQAQASMSALQMSLDPPDRPRPSNLNQRVSLYPVEQGLPNQRAQVMSVVTLLAAIVGALLVITCANVANLLLSRAMARRREIAVRLAVGAGRARLVRQLLTESLLLALAGGALGIALAYGLVQAFRAWPPPPGALPLALDFSVDMSVVLFTLAVSIVTGLVFGLAPALRAARPELVPALKDESFVPDEHARRFNLKNALVVVQVAVSLALLIGSGLFLRSLNEAQRIDTGYAAERLVTLGLPVNLLRYTRAQSRELYRQVVETAEAVPGVASAAVARVAVLTGSTRTYSLHVEGREGPDSVFQAEGGAVAATDDSVNANVVSPRYFSTMGLAMREGRDFGAEDVEGGAPVVIVNETFVRRHLPDGRALGRRLSLRGPQGPWRTIVGVVSDGKYASINETPVTIAYLPLSQNHETGVTLYVRTTSDPLLVSGALARGVQALEPNLPLGDARPMSYVLGASLYLARMAALLIGVLGLLALVLASIGLYGVLAFAVSRRTREIGIRSALGARTATLFKQVVLEGMSLVGVGMAIGLAVAWSASGLIARFLVGVRPTEPATYLAVACVLSMVAVAACAVPAWRATKVDPLVALRQQ